jgi:hypothetical protein
VVEVTAVAAVSGTSPTVAVVVRHGVKSSQEKTPERCVKVKMGRSSLFLNGVGFVHGGIMEVG